MDSKPLLLLARWRPDLVMGRSVVAVRWVLAPPLSGGSPSRYGTPVTGFELTRQIDRGAPFKFTWNWRLPGALQTTADLTKWKIDLATLASDLRVRSQGPAGISAGPKRPKLATSKELVPVLTYALLKPDDEELFAHFRSITKILAGSHRHDAELTQKYWQNLQGVPTVDQLLAMAGSDDANEKKIFEAVRFHYQRAAFPYLQILAMDFGMAKFLGLGIEDVLPAETSPNATIRYELVAKDEFPWGQFLVDGLTVRTSAYKGMEIPQPPKMPTLKVDKNVTLIGYPAFKEFYDCTLPNPWVKVLSAVGIPELDALIKVARIGPRLYPSAMTQIEWNWEPPLELEVEPLERLRPLMWQVESEYFGTLPNAPEIRATTPFRTCRGADHLRDQEPNYFLDDPMMPWGELPREGWYAYRIRGIDLFGMVGKNASLPNTIKLEDTFAPPPPGIHIQEAQIEFPAQGVKAVRMSLEWSANNEFTAPDVIAFKIYLLWTSLLFEGVRIIRTVPLPNDRKLLEVNICIQTPDGESIPESTLVKFVAGTLLTADGEYIILAIEDRDSSVLRVQRSAGRTPPLGGASIRYASRKDETNIVVKRSPAQPAKLTLISIDPLMVELESLNTHERIAGSSGTVHLTLLQESFSCSAATIGALQFLLAEPVEKSPAAKLLRALRQLGLARSKSFLDSSPSLFLPEHELDLSVRPPETFQNGTLKVSVSACDLPRPSASVGNEGTRNTAYIVAWRMLPPAWPMLPPEGAPPNPKKVWARGAAEFVDTAEVLLAWTGAIGAMRYEVERAFESALGVGPRMPDKELIAAAMNPDTAKTAFERCTNHAFINEWTDRLPGRAPARAIYRVRGVSAAGAVSEDWSIVALVRVPDVRIPPCPNFIQLRPGADRSVNIGWTQPGPLVGIGFQIETRAANGIQAADENWVTIAEYLPATLVAQAGTSFLVSLDRQRPGELREFRVLAVRHALDPIDPRMRRTREIRSRPSNILATRATGTLQAPAGLSVVEIKSDAHTRIVELRWSNRDAYDGIELRRRAPDRYGYERVIMLAGVADSFREPAKLFAAGLWTYELAAIGGGQRAVSERVVIEIKL